ncbi:MAG: hypothetical protein ABW110_09890 [Steroidobacteraceae bacterium]
MSARIRQQWLRCLGLSAVLCVSSCGGGGGGSDSGGGGSDSGGSSPASIPVSQRPTSLTDLQIAQLLYEGSPRTPADFYAEAAPASYAYVNTSHLKNTDVATVASDAPQYELCSDDWNEALAWSEAAQQRSGQYADLMATEENERYFEFGRVRSSEPDRYLRGRVFKCAYLERQTSNLRQQAGNAGVLKSTPIDTQSLKLLSEYLWQFTTYNNYGHAVLSSTGEPANSSLRRTLLIANLAAAGTSGTCDRILVEAWRHDAATATGALTRSVEELWSFGARENAGAVELCN